MNKFVVCLNSGEVALFILPLVALFLFEVALVLAFIQDCCREGLFPERILYRRREEASAAAVLVV